MSAKFLLSQPQINRLKKGNSINLKYSQLNNPEKKYNKEVEIKLNTIDLNRLDRALNNLKGWRITSDLFNDSISGGKFNLKISKKLGKKIIRDTGKQIIDDLPIKDLPKTDNLEKFVMRGANDLKEETQQQFEDEKDNLQNLIKGKGDFSKRGNREMAKKYKKMFGGAVLKGSQEAKDRMARVR